MAYLIAFSVVFGYLAVLPVTARCRCDRYPDHPCANPVTQEDLLCDGCRGRTVRLDGQRSFFTTGCGAMIAGTEQAGWHVPPFALEWRDVTW